MAGPEAEGLELMAVELVYDLFMQGSTRSPVVSMLL